MELFTWSTKAGEELCGRKKYVKSFTRGKNSSAKEKRRHIPGWKVKKEKIRGESFAKGARPTLDGDAEGLAPLWGRWGKRCEDKNAL